MLVQNIKSVLTLLIGVSLLGACSSAIFPDFEDEDSEVIIHDGGKVELRKIENNGVLVADKDNAAYEGEKDETEVNKAASKVETVTPAQVVRVKKEDVKPLKKEDDKVIVSQNEKIKKEEAKLKAPTMHYLAATVYFENGGAVVDSSYNTTLKKIARLVKENDATVTVYGFASSRTRDTDPASHKLANFKVSAERADNTARALRRAGVPADKISVQALSDSMPLYQEVMPEGERLNRRAEIYLTY